jgi:outer membrane lipoprotein-sorting protein
MRLGTNLVLAASLATFAAMPFVSGRTALAAAPDQKNLPAVLQELNVAAANFHSTAASFEFDSIQTDPIPDTERQTGTVYYERKNNVFQMAAHIDAVNGKPAPKVYTYSKGVFQLYESGIDQVTKFAKASQFESYIILGFGASGKDLADKWDITDLGTETIGGIKTEKLELIAKDPTVRKNLVKVTIWLDLTRAVSLKQVFDEGQGQSRVCTYSSIKVNQPISTDNFTFKTDSKTQFVNR